MVAVAALAAASSSTPHPVVTSAVHAHQPRMHTPVATDLVLSFTGDNILGTDDKFSTASSLPTLWEQSGRRPDYFFRNVRQYFDADDLTVANFEVALTNWREKRYKGEGEVYHFHGDAALAHTLPAGGIDVVTVANNHTFDYGQRGFDDTLAALRSARIGYFGTGDASEGSDYDMSLLRTVNGVTIGLVGYQTWTDTPEVERKIRTDFDRLRAAGADVLIPFFHWGIESEHTPYEVQTNLAHLAIDAGADLVVGTHPHVIQSMEIYRGKLIAYAFGNFASAATATRPTNAPSSCRRACTPSTVTYGRWIFG